jgi:dihydrofolate reductase
MKSAIILASSLNDCIGNDNSLPWKLAEDLKRFKKITTAHENSVVIMGRKTFESIGKPLPGRINYVISKNFKPEKGVSVNIFPSLKEAVEDILGWERFLGIEYHVFFIGGMSIFKEAIDHKYADTIYHTSVQANISGDVFFKVPAVSEETVVNADDKNQYKTIFRILKRS